MSCIALPQLIPVEQSREKILPEVSGISWQWKFEQEDVEGFPFGQNNPNDVHVLCIESQVAE